MFLGFCSLVTRCITISDCVMIWSLIPDITSMGFDQWFIVSYEIVKGIVFRVGFMTCCGSALSFKITITKLHVTKRWMFTVSNARGHLVTCG